jgi:copper homeostasis protein
MILEVCVESHQGALAAIAGGADRVELCADLYRGGCTPSHGSLKLAARELPGQVVALIRPRGGDFQYDAEDLSVCLEDIRHAAELGAAGVAVGALASDGRVDRAATGAMVEAAGDLPVTFHRAFDWSADPIGDLEVLIELGVRRLLTSGGAQTALEGRSLLRQLVQLAGDRLEIVVAGGVRVHNARELARSTGAPALHFSAFEARPPATYTRVDRVKFSASELPPDSARRATDSGLVAELRASLQS